MSDAAALRARAEDLRTWRAEFPDVSAIEAVVPRQRNVVVGVVIRVRLDPGRSFDVVVEDGTGRLTASFSGRSHVPGIELGAGLRLTGTVAVEKDGTRRMRNPEYAFVQEPYR
jgi:hypothetical protein